MLAVQINPEVQAMLSMTHRTYKETRLSKARKDGGYWECPRVDGAIRCNQLNPLDADVTNVLSKVVWRPNNQHEFKLTGEYFSSDTDVRQLYDYGWQANGSFNGDYLRNQRQTRGRIAIADTWTPLSNYVDRVKWQLSYSPQKRNLTSNRDQINTSGQSVHTYTQTHYKENFLELDVQLSSSLNTASTRHTLTYGFQGDTTKTDYTTKTITENYTLASIVERVAGGANFANAKTRRADLFIQDEIKLLDDRFTLTPGVRWATYQIDPKTDENYTIMPGKEPRKLSANRWVPEFGMMYQLTPVYSVYGRYAEGFKMPTAQQLYTSYQMSSGAGIIPNPDLKPEKVKSYEIGVRGQYQNAWFSLSGFIANYDDYIQSFTPIGTDYTYSNLSQVKIKGVEAFAEWRFLPQWALNDSVSYLYGRQKASEDAEETYYNGVSPLTATLGLKWTHADKKLDAEIIGTFANKVTVSESETDFKAHGYTVFDAYLSFKPTKNFTLRASILNLFDRRYFAVPFATAYSMSLSSAVAATNPLELQTAPGRVFGLDISARF